MGNSTTVGAHIVRLVLSLATLAVAGMGIVTATSGAMFTDTAIADMDVSSSWVDVAVGGATMVPLSNLKPGDVIFRPVNIANTGSLDFSYEITTERKNGPSAALVDALEVETWKTPTAEACELATYQGGIHIGTASSLTHLSMSNPNLVAGTAETVCLRISLPPTTSNTAAGKNATVTFTIASQQV